MNRHPGLNRRRFAYVIALVAWIPSVQATTYVVDGNLPNGGACETAPTHGIWSTPLQRCLTDGFEVLSIDELQIVDATIYTSGPISNHGTITAVGGGILRICGSDSWPCTAPGSITNHGTIDASNSSSIFNVGTIVNSGTVQGNGEALVNHGTTTNSGTITNLDWNTGTLVNLASGIIENSFVGLTNSGTLMNFGVITNTGTLDSSGQIHNHGDLTNDGTLINRGIITNDGSMVNDGTLTNQICTFLPCGFIFNSGTFLNNGLTVNEGDLYNKESGTITNLDSIDNSGQITTLGTITNAATITNSGNIIENCLGTLDGNPVSGPPPVSGVLFGSPVGDTYTWCERTGNSYQVASGDLGVLRSTDGDFTQATVDCQNVADNAFGFDQTPGHGEGVWFFARPVDGTFDSGGPGEVEPRDAEVIGSGLCP